MPNFTLDLRLFVFSIILFGTTSISTITSAETVISVFGDSLVSGFGVNTRDSFPEQLQNELRLTNPGITVLNAGVSGDTTSSGLARLSWVLETNPHIIILVLGSNDMLRGIAPGITRKNLSTMVEEIQSKGVSILLCGMKASRNLGRFYVEEFDSIYPSITKKYALVLYPFFLDGVALVPELNQADLIHPNSKGVSVIVSRILPSISEVLRRYRAEQKNTE